MTQTASQRRREVDEARRRSLMCSIEMLAKRSPWSQAMSAESWDDLIALGAQACAALEALSGDELEVVEIALEPGASYQLRPAYRLRAVAAVIDRLLLGRVSYGELRVDVDPRDIERERNEELADAAVYGAMILLLERREGLQVDLPERDLQALANLSSTRDQLARRIEAVRRSDEHTPPPPPTPWCAGSGKLASLFALRIERDEIVAVRCSFCRREWSTRAPELRWTDDWQAVIPTHEDGRP